jgi:hypothetical protein
MSSCADKYPSRECAGTVLARRQPGDVAIRWMALRAKLIESYTAFHFAVTSAAESKMEFFEAQLGASQALTQFRRGSALVETGSRD